MLILTQVEVIVEVLVELGNSKKIFWFKIVLVNTMSDKKKCCSKIFQVKKFLHERLALQLVAV